MIPDIAFYLIAATLERGVSENHFWELKDVTPSETDSMVGIPTRLLCQTAIVPSPFHHVL
jgi:hypothetical protein